MKKKWLLYETAVFILGAGIGIWKSHPTRASSPEGETIGITNYLICWDEEWQAIEAYHSSKTGYKAFDPSKGQKPQFPAALTLQVGMLRHILKSL